MPILKIRKNCFVFLACCFVSTTLPASNSEWSESELALLRLQWIGSLPALPPDPTNKYADNPAAIKLGHKLFFDKRFSANGEVACASCHKPGKSFTDGLARSRGIGETSRSAPGIIGIAFSPWFFWDGRSDSLWSQALGPLESAVEHGGNRSQYARIIYRDPTYRKMYEELFDVMPDLSDITRFPINAAPVSDLVADAKWLNMSDADRKSVTRIYVNMGKAIAAYERLLLPGPSRFDNYVEAVLKGNHTGRKILSANEIAGLKLFIGKAMCITCHQGPLFTNHGFHNVASPDPAAKKPEHMLPLFFALKDKPPADTGRLKGIQQALESEFNCINEYSDAKVEDCAELKFANKKRNEISGTFKVPTLRNITSTAPYMHAGQFANLADVLKHYNTAPTAPVGYNELKPLNLKLEQLEQIESFLHSLTSTINVDAELLQNPNR